MRVTRIHFLVGAGLTDSFALSLGWTVFVLYASQSRGLGAAGVYTAAMLAGVALSAPSTSLVARRLDGRSLLRLAACAEAVLRIAMFGLLVGSAPLGVVAGAVTLMNVAAWMGYAGMRAEIAAVDGRATTMTAFVAGIASVEALGIAVGAALAVDPGRPGGEGLFLLGVVAFYAASLLPTIAVATGSRVPRARARVDGRPAGRLARPLLGGFVLMALASGPTLLAAAVGMALHGRIGVVIAALAFTVGSLLSPKAAAMVGRADLPSAVCWPAIAMGMVVGWTLAPLHLVGLAVAQLLSGLCMSAFEGMMDARAASNGDGRVTSVLAWAAATRALGSAVAVALAPRLIESTSVAAVTVGLSLALGACVLGGVMWFVPRSRTLEARPRVGRAAPGSSI